MDRISQNLNKKKVHTVNTVTESFRTLTNYDYKNRRVKIITQYKNIVCSTILLLITSFNKCTEVASKCMSRTNIQPRYSSSFK